MQSEKIKENIIGKGVLFVIVILFFTSFSYITTGIPEHGQMKLTHRENQQKDTQLIYSTGFEEKWMQTQINQYIAPSDWIIQGMCSGYKENNQELTHYWSKVERDFSYTHTYWKNSPLNSPFVHSGEFAAGIWGNDGYKEPAYQGDQSDEWLISPSFDFSQYYDITLEFWSIYVPTQRITMPFPYTISVDNTYLIKTSVDDGDTWNTIADLKESRFRVGVNQIQDVYNDFDEPITLNLDKLKAKNNVRIGWHYQYAGNGTNDLWIIDDVSIHAKFDSYSPDIDITKPKENNLYLFNDNSYPIQDKTILIGPTEVKADPTDTGTGTRLVKFYIDNSLMHTDEEYPFSWEWKKLGCGKYTIKTVAVDYAGNSNEASLSVIKIL